ncbi:serine/threonine-protein phosphatase [Verrucomicrobiaceae bacterium 5K15]|uniref:Serine/threonine-protein phosphatase n=1 Tax=Oceaniferula flava TaxID=2800421 RepID=A0AAE2VEE5_9BACT|nr:protein phosphatase 2C domain-containing protein [Oceaniferula flavus]MBK1855719.1 serine/threonine-protein phosphatase [Oceaniferula flavus]MBM1137026.1 serine/threonine-protein phosphatase [Oceaniferula flavus]
MPDINPFLPGAPKLEPDAAPSDIEWSALSQSGSRKPVNDDSWLAFASDINGAARLDDQGSHSLAAHDLIFGVSDGMGGGNAGDVASRLILDELTLVIPGTFKTAAAGLHPDYTSHLEKAICAVHEAINIQAAANEAHQGMAATLALAWFTPENLYFANVGDSRIYLHRNGETKMITVDHTYAWKKLERGEISERQFREHPRKSVLYQVMGAGKNQTKPTIGALSYQPGDRFLICSDGVIDGLWEKNIHSAFSKNQGSTSELASSLMNRAISNDGRDDTTLITIEVHEGKSTD